MERERDDQDAWDRELLELLRRSAAGDADAEAEVVRRLGPDLHTLAHSLLRRQRRDHTLQPTALVNEFWMRKRAIEDARSAREILCIAAGTMRKILVTYARAKLAKKRRKPPRTTNDEREWTARAAPPEEVIDVHDAVEDLRQDHPRAARVVELAFFLGLTQEEIAPILGVSVRTVQHDAQLATGFLRRRLGGHGRDAK